MTTPEMPGPPATGRRPDESAEATRSASTLGDLVDFVDDPVRRAALRRAKRGATGLLAVAAVIYVLTFLAADESAVIGFVRAAAEAGIVGGLADWFAVTALFRRPLGLPIPHTALVPTRKDALAASLGAFVTGHFLTRENVRDRLARARVVERLGARLATPAVASRVAEEVGSVVTAAVSSLRAEDVADLLLDVARRDTVRRSYAALGGRLLADVTAGGAHRPLLDVALPYARASIVEHRQVAHDLVKSLAERNGLLGWLWSTDARVARLLDGVLETLAEMADDPAHEVRVAIDRSLRRLAEDLQRDATLAGRVDDVVARVLADRRTREWLRQVVGEVLAAVGDSVNDPSGPGAQRLARALVDLGERAQQDPVFQSRLERQLEAAVLYAIDHYAEEFTRLVQDTVARWDGRATAERIELAAGRDLQFIRINGTVVGALAGTAIHAAAVVLG